MEGSSLERGQERGGRTAEARPAAPSPLELRVRLASHVASAAQARALVGATLRTWHVPELLDDALLVTSELVTNAVLHAAGSGIEMVVQLIDHAVRVEVHDDSVRLPAPRASTDQETTGRGLALVNAVAASWGVDESAAGKRVWAEVG